MSNNVQEVLLTPLNPATSHNWTVDHGGVSSSNPADYPKVHLPKDKGPFLIHFSIQGANNVKFGPDPIWVNKGSKPTVSGLDSQIVSVVPSKDGKDLYVVDWNHGNQGDLYYAMSFTGHGSLDPIIDNGGGNIYSPSALQVAEAVGAVFLALAVGIFIQKTFRLL